MPMEASEIGASRAGATAGAAFGGAAGRETGFGVLAARLVEGVVREATPAAFNVRSQMTIGCSGAGRAICRLAMNSTLRVKTGSSTRSMPRLLVMETADLSDAAPNRKVRKPDFSRMLTHSSLRTRFELGLMSPVK